MCQGGGRVHLAAEETSSGGKFGRRAQGEDTEGGKKKTAIRDQNVKKLGEGGGKTEEAYRSLKTDRK